MPVWAIMGLQSGPHDTAKKWRHFPTSVFVKGLDRVGPFLPGTELKRGEIETHGLCPHSS